MMKTQFITKEEADSDRRWYHVDATDRVLGRLATSIATWLMGKDRPDYTPHVDSGAYVVVTNAERVRLTGRKLEQKTYPRYTGYPGGLKEIPIQKMLAKHPDEVIRLAVRRMLPKTKLGRHMLKKLKVYRGPKHPHTYQKPETREP